MEPNYVFIKGQGWVYENDNIITMYCGTICRLENRLPLPHEHFDAVSIDQHEAFDAEWLKFIKSRYYNQLSLRWDKYRDIAHKYQFRVIVPVHV